jgi:hypothetical protein
LIIQPSGLLASSIVCCFGVLRRKRQEETNMEMRIYPWDQVKGEFLSSIPIKLDAAPEIGQYISVSRFNIEPRDQGTEDFIVRRLCWEAPWDVDNIPSTESHSLLRIECEMVIADSSSQRHRDNAGANGHKKETAPF